MNTRSSAQGKIAEEIGSGEDFIRCPSCHAAGYTDDRFCSCCGESLGNICGWCGTRITHPIAHFCSQCGIPLGRQKERPAR